MLAWALAAYQENYGGSSGGGVIAALFGGVFSLVILAISIVMIASFWKIFTKAGKPGWASLIPIYNLVVLLEVIHRPIWWIVLFMCLGPVGWILASLDLAKVFGKEMGFAIGIMFLPFIFLPMLAFGDAQYRPALNP